MPSDAKYKAQDPASEDEPLSKREIIVQLLQAPRNPDAVDKDIDGRLACIARGLRPRVDDHPFRVEARMINTEGGDLRRSIGIGPSPLAALVSHWIVP